VEAFKFLDSTGTSVLTGFRWPLPADGSPGPWVEAAGVRPCRAGVHACAADDLAYWIADHLWVVELAGETAPGRHKVAARRGRLIHRIDAWHLGVQGELAADVTWRSRDLALSALRHVGHHGMADRLAACSSGPDLAAVCAEIAGTVGEASAVGTAALLAADCASFAAPHESTGAPYAAACAAGHAATMTGGTAAAYQAAFHAERVRQSRWVAQRLDVAGLPT